MIKRQRDADGDLVGKSNDNPILVDTAVYEVEFPNGEVEAYTANIIAEHIYSQVDDDGYNYYTFDEITDCRYDETALFGDDPMYVKGGQKVNRRTTKGWELCVRWKDGSSSWVKLKDMKDSNPIETAEYAVACCIDKQPPFIWWVKHTLKHRDRMLKAMKKRYFRMTQKYGIELPKTVKRALEIDKETGTTFWRDALEKEMKNVGIAFKMLEEDEKVPPGYEHIFCHVVMDIKPDMTRKCRLVAGASHTEPESGITYASVVSRESVRIAFMLAALNDLDILACDIGNAYLNAECREKVYTTCGPEFGKYEGRRALIVRALYGLKSSGAAFRAKLSATLQEHLKFVMCSADNNVYYRAATREDGMDYYEYILVYTDDILILSTKPQVILEHLQSFFRIKDESIGPPTKYLGSDVSKYRFQEDGDGGKEYWALGSTQYVKESIRNVEIWLDQRGRALKNKVSSVLPTKYRPELDATPLLGEEDAGFYHSQIGVLRWAVELGRIDICGEVSMMAAFSAAPRKGHLEAVMHIFAWMKKHERSRMVCDAAYFDWDPPKEPDWSDFYPGAKEAAAKLIPPDMPEPRGKVVQVTTYEDSDHAGDQVTRRSRTGVIIFCNRTPVLWYSKKQTSIETSSFGSEFSALKTAVELTEGVIYKLRMMGVPVEVPAMVMGDNQSVITNSSVPASMLQKKSNSIAYHYTRERAAMGVVAMVYVHTSENLADMLTKTQAGSVRLPLVKKVLY